MTQFEFISIAGSIIFALSIGRLVAALPYVKNASKTSPLFTSQYFALFLLQLLLWWGFWELNVVQEWDVFGYLLFMGTPIAYYLTTFVLLSDDPKNIHDWVAHYKDQSKFFAGALSVAWAIGLIRTLYLEDLQPFGVVFSIATLSVFLTGYFSNNRALHWVINIWIWLVLVLTILAGRFYAEGN